MTRVIFRGYSGGVLQFREELDADVVDLELVAERHVHALPEKHMLEVEFPDDPDPRHRFFRIGTETIGMRHPVAVDLRETPS